MNTSVEINIGGVRQELLEAQRGDLKAGPETRVVSVGVLSRDSEMAGALSSAPGTDGNIGNLRPDEIPPEVLPKTINEYLEKERAVVNEAEVYKGVVRPGEIEFKKKDRSLKEYALWGMLPLNTRNKRELYNLIKDIQNPVIVLAVILGLKTGWEGWSSGRITELQQSQLAPGMVYLLDPQKNQSGEQIKKILTDYAKNADLDNKDSWPNNSEIRQVIGAWKTFWEVVSEPKQRKELIKTLPDGSVKDILKSLPNRKLTDQEIEQLLVEKGVTKENAHLFEQIVIEMRDGTGNVTEALKTAK